MMGPIYLVVMVTLLLSSLAGSVMASLKANCTVYPAFMNIVCSTNFSEVTIKGCTITKSYIHFEVPYTTSSDGQISIDIPSDININEVHVTVNRSKCDSVTKEITVSLMSHNTKRPVNASCEVDQGLKEGPECNSTVTNQQCIAQKCLITYEVKFTDRNDGTVEMMIPDGVDIHKYNVTPILMSGCGSNVEVSVTRNNTRPAVDPDRLRGTSTPSTAPPPGIPEGIVVAIVGSGIAVVMIVLITGVLVLKRRRDAWTKNTPKKDLEQPLSTSSEETSA